MAINDSPSLRIHLENWGMLGTVVEAEVSAW